MLKTIRSVIFGILLVLVLIVGVVLLFLDTWIEWGAEKALGDANGAEVNIESVSHTWSPFGVTLFDVQITDPANPEVNKLQAQQVKADVRLSPLLINKVIVDKLVIADVEFKAPRDSAGDVYRVPDTGKHPLLDISKDDLPSIDEIIANSPLKTTQAIDATEAAYQQHKGNVEQRYEALPDKATLESYKAKFDALKETDFKNPAAIAEAKAQFEQLKAELRADKQKISDFKAAVSAARKDLSPQLKALQQAPAEDYAQVKSLLAGDQDAIRNITQQVLGDKAALWVDSMLSAYNTIAPMLADNQDAQPEQPPTPWPMFAEDANLPDILVKEAEISLRWQNESLTSVWRNITHQHELIGEPTTFVIDAAKNALWQAFDLNGDFRFSEAGLNASQNWDIRGLTLEDLPLANSEKLTTFLQQALLASAGSLTVRDNALSGSGELNFSDMLLQATGSNQLTRSIAAALNELKELAIQTDLSGTFRAPEVAFSSNLDKLISAAVVNNLSDEQKAKLDKLRTELEQKVKAPLAKYSEELAVLGEYVTSADKDLSTVESMLSNKFETLLDKQKDKLTDKLKKKLFGN